MSLQDKEEQKKLAFQFIGQQTLGTIATISKELAPEAATVSFFMDTDWTLYVVTHDDSRKVKNISFSSQVVFVIGTVLIPQTVQIQGTAVVIPSSHPDFQIISEKIRNSGRMVMDPILHAYASNYILIKITPTWIRYLRIDQTTNKENYTVIFP